MAEPVDVNVCMAVDVNDWIFAKSTCREIETDP